MSEVILAIDLGKYKSVFCWFDPTTKSTAFRTVKTSPALFEAEITREPIARVVIEACSPAGWVHDLCERVSTPCEVANTSGEAWAWKNVKRKTDHDDALKLAKLSGIGELATVAVPAANVRQWKSLIGLRKRLVGDRVRGQNRIRGLLVSQGLPAPMGAKAWTALGLEGLGQLAKPMAACGVLELWRGELQTLLDRHRFLEQELKTIEAKLDELSSTSASVKLLESVPGIGPRTAEIIATHLGDAKRFTSADEVSAYAGLVPKQYQSGLTDRRGRITKRGSKLLRSALVECAWCSLRYNEWARGVWLKLQSNGVSKKKAIVALARKLLVRCWGMLRSGQAWKNPLV